MNSSFSGSYSLKKKKEKKASLKIKVMGYILMCYSILVCI